MIVFVEYWYYSMDLKAVHFYWMSVR